jgi:hypothetical protein
MNDQSACQIIEVRYHYSAKALGSNVIATFHFVSLHCSGVNAESWLRFLSFSTSDCVKRLGGRAASGRCGLEQGVHGSKQQR